MYSKSVRLDGILLLRQISFHPLYLFRERHGPGARPTAGLVPAGWRDGSNILASAIASLFLHKSPHLKPLLMHLVPSLVQAVARQ
jgi:hypothetical protein